MDYFQINIGGFDPMNLIRFGREGQLIQGYVGCIRGLMIGEYLVDLPNLASEANHEGSKGVLPNCQRKCDAIPCKNQGICTEDFGKQESSCNCELTSYFGEYCNDEKGADFSGESVLQRDFVLDGPVQQIKVQLAFSTNDLRQRTSALLLLQTENKRSYYLLVALTSEGQLIFEEDREGSAYGVRLNDRNFLNGARHSIYYVRDNNTSVLLIDRDPVQLLPIPVLNIGDDDGHDALNAIPGATEIQLGGLNTTDQRFSAYKGYTGCLSNVLVSINGAMMKPLEEYMLFTKKGSETVRATIPTGVRSAQCAVFHAQPRGPEPSRNDSVGRDRAWVEDPPARVLYKSLYNDEAQEEQRTGTYIFIGICCVFATILFCCTCEVVRSSRRDRKRRQTRGDTSSIKVTTQGESSRWQSSAYSGSMIGPLAGKSVGFKKTVEDEKRPNGNHTKLPKVPETKNEAVDGDKKIHIKANDEPERKELLGVNNGNASKPAKLSPFSMEDLTEEPELEEREQAEDHKTDDSIKEEKNSESDILIQPTTASCISQPMNTRNFRGISASGMRLLDKNFSVTGLNEIGTNEFLINDHSDQYLHQDINISS